MKKKYLHVTGAKHWNSLLNKFANLNRRLQTLSSNTAQYNKLVKKLQHLFSRLEKMQYQTGIKLAGTSLALVLSAHTANAQFDQQGVDLKYNGAIIPPARSSSTFADVDGDGDNDLYVGNSDGRSHLYTNENGQFTAAAASLTNGTATSNASPVFADIDGDNDLDVYVGNGAGNIIVRTNNNGTYTGALLQADGADIDLGVNASPTFADLDGDSDLDLYVGDGAGKIRVYTNNAGAFTFVGDLGLTGPNTIASYVGVNATPAFADIDGDSDLDLYVGGYQGTVTLFTNNGGAFTHAGVVQADGVDINIGKSSSPEFTDIDNDSDLDLILNGNNSDIQIFTNTAGTFSANGNIEAENITLDVGLRSTPTFADVDGDGDLDLYVGSGGNDSEIKVYTNDGGTFTDVAVLPLTLSWSEYSLAPVFEDIDGDSDLDLYVGSYYGTIAKWENNGGNFSNPVNVEAGGSALSAPYYPAPAFADIDGDGDLDLYVGHYGYVDLYTNTAGVFSSGTRVQGGGVDIDVNYDAAPTFADLDGDGDLDLYVGNNAGNIVNYTNNLGVFAAGVNVLADNGGDLWVGSAAKPAFADLDGDGDLDIYTGGFSGRVRFHENTTLHVGVNEAANQTVSVSPNPATNQLFIDANEASISELNILDISGKTIKTIAGINANNSIDISDLSQGVYVLKAQTETGVATSRFVKQ